MEDVLPLSENTATGTRVQIQGIELGVVSVPLHVVCLSSELLTGQVTVGTRPTLPIKGISLILGNDLAGSKVMPDLQLVNNPTAIIGVNVVESSIFPACDVTRAAAKRGQEKANETSVTVDIGDDVNRATPSQTSQMATEDGIKEPCPSMNRQQLIQEQQRDVKLSQLTKEAVSEEQMPKHAQCYYIKSGVLMRKWRPPDAPASEE